MNTSVLNKVPGYKVSGRIINRSECRNTSKDRAVNSDQVLTPLPYNLIMEIETMLKNISISSPVDDMAHSIDAVYSVSNSDQTLQAGTTSHWTENALQAFGSMAKMCSVEQLQQLETVLNVFFNSLSGDLFDLVEQFPLDIDLHEDDFISVDWTFKNLAIGFTIEPDRKFSGWWASSNVKAGNLLLAGLIPDDDKINEKVKFCLQLVLDNIKGLMA